MRIPRLLRGFRSLPSCGEAIASRRKPVVSTVCALRWFCSSTPNHQNAATLQLRDYQEESIASVLDHLSKGERRLGLSLATGSGKTVVFSHLIDRVPSPKPGATQTLVLAHRRELVEQAARHCRHVYPRKTIEIEMGDVKASGSADITIASVLSIARRLDKYDPEAFKLLIVDEAHHITASSYTAILEHFALDKKDGDGHSALVGVSATFSRADGVSLGSAIDYIVYHRDYLDMIDSKYLADLIFTTVQTKVDLSDVKVSRGDFVDSALSKVVNNPETNALTVRSWLAKADKRHSTLVFCVDISHVESLTAEFQRHDIDAYSVTSHTSRETRAERLHAFKAGDIPVLLNCGIFTEGTDIPNIDCVVLARPTKSRNLLVQMIGRGLRLSVGKKNCHIIDMVSSLEQGIVTTPTLFGLENEILDEATSEGLKEKQERRKADVFSLTGSNSQDIRMPSNITFTDYDSVNDLVEDTSGERRIRAISALGWVEAIPGKYILSNLNGDYLTIRRCTASDDSPFEVVITRKLHAETRSKSPFMKPQTIATALTFEATVHAADTFARKHFPFSYVSKFASWRRQAATDGQVDFLNKTRGENAKLEAGNVTKGAASDWITKMKHGAKGQLGKIERGRKADMRQQERRERQSRQEPGVGPLR